MTIELSELPRHVLLRTGERIKISLPSYANSGYNWSSICLRGEDVAKVSVELGDIPPVEPVPTDGTAEPPALMLVPEFAVIEALACGKAMWRLVLDRSFERSNPLSMHEINITVVEL